MSKIITFDEAQSVLAVETKTQFKTEILAQFVEETTLDKISLDKIEDLGSCCNQVSLYGFLENDWRKTLIVYISKSLLTPKNESIIDDKLLDLLALKGNNEITDQYYSDFLDCLVIKIKKT